MSNRPGAAVSIWPIDGGPLFQLAINSAAATVVAIPAIAKTILRIHRIWFVVAATTNLTFEDGGSALSGAVPMLANGAFVLDLSGWPWFTTSSGNAFNILNSGTAQISGTVDYTKAPTGTDFNAL